MTPRGGHIADVATVRARLTAAQWDQRPGALEATLGLSVPPLAVCGVRDDDGWRVRLSIAGGPVLALSPAQARKLAAELGEYADIAEGKRW